MPLWVSIETEVLAPKDVCKLLSARCELPMKIFNNFVIYVVSALQDLVGILVRNVGFLS